MLGLLIFIFLYYKLQFLEKYRFTSWRKMHHSPSSSLYAEKSFRWRFIVRLETAKKSATSLTERIAGSVCIFFSIASLIIAHLSKNPPGPKKKKKPRRTAEVIGCLPNRWLQLSAPGMVLFYRIIPMLTGFLFLPPLSKRGAERAGRQYRLWRNTATSGEHLGQPRKLSRQV